MIPGPATLDQDRRLVEARQQALLDAIMKLRSRPGRGVDDVAARQGFETIDTMLAEGLDLNFRCSRDDLVAAARVEVSPLSLALLLEPGSYQQRLLGALLDHGANLLMDEILAELMTKKMRSRSKLADFLAARLAHMEQGMPARTPDGGNLCHAVAQHDAQLILSWLHPNHPICDTARQWIGQVNDQAALPLDVAITAAGWHMTSGGRLEDDYIEAIYKLVERMLANETDQSLQGRDDLGPVLAAMHGGINSRVAIMERLDNLWCRRDLEKHTAMARGAAKVARL